MPTPLSPEAVFAGILVLLREPSRWTKRASARRHDGMPCDPCAPQAVAWDIYGALDYGLFQIADETQRGHVSEACDEILHEVCHGASPSAFNDDRSTTHMDMLKLVGTARNRAEDHASGGLAMFLNA